MGHLLLAEGRYAEALPLLREAEARGVAGCAAPVTLNRAVAAGRAGLKAEAGDALRRAALNMPEWPARIEQARKDAGL
jgi:Tfp pilus assembly protein PilF